MARGPWIWVSLGLAVAVVGLAVWGLSLRSDLDSSQARVTELETELAQAEESGGALATAAQEALSSLSERLAGSSDDLAAARERITAAKEALERARQTAADEARSQADRARAEIEELQARATIATDCAKAYIGAFKSLFEGNLLQQIPAVGSQLQGITADCQAALTGS